MATFFLEQNIKKLSKDNKVEMLQLFELVTYLAATKEISLNDAQKYTSKLFNILEE
jgi:hypothetical protein